MNIAPVLMCVWCKAPTLHVFAERRAQAREPGEMPYVDCVYECATCGKQRVWGSEPRRETAYGRRLAAEELAHAVDRHGMRRARCPVCDGRGLECRRCDEDGQAWVFEKLEPCGTECPFAALEPVVDE